MRTVGRRGGVLLEALVAGALVLVVLGSLSTAWVQASRDGAIARDDQEAWAIAEAKLEQLLASPPRSWAVGTVGPAPIAGKPPSWQLTVTVADAADPSTAGVTLRRAQVLLDYRADGRRVQLETARWLAPLP